MTETDRANSNPDRLIASCPNCNDAQVVFAHRIISVTVDKNIGVFPQAMNEVTSIAAEREGRQSLTKRAGRI